MLRPSAEVVTSISATSKPRAFSRSTRSLMRQRSREFVPQALVAVLDGVHEPLRVQRRVQHSAGLQIAELAEQVDAGDLLVVGALPGRQLVVEFAGLGVHEVGGELAGVAAEQDVGQRDVAPVETGEVQPGEQRHHGIQQPVDGVELHARVEQCAVGQREREVPGQEDGVQRAAVVVGATQDHPHRFHGGDVEAAQFGELAVLVDGHLLQDLLGGEDVVTHLDEPHDVAGDASGQCHEVDGRPVLQGDVPRQPDEIDIRFGGEEPGHVVSLVLRPETATRARRRVRGHGRGPLSPRRRGRRGPRCPR